MVSKNTLLLLNLVRDYIKQESSEEALENFIRDNDSDIDWKGICVMATQNGVLPFVYHQIKGFANKYNITQNLLVWLKNTIIYRSSRQIKANECLGTVIDAFNNAGIKFMILKGIVMAELYPHPDYRYSGDADIHIAPEYLEAAQKILEELGYEYTYVNTQKYDFVYVLKNLYSVELHTRLFEDFYDKHKKTLEEYEISSLENSMKFSISRKEFLSLKPNEFLIYTLCHMTKHYVGSGIALRQLMDISIYINAHINQLDIDHITNLLKKMKVEKFILYTFFACQKYLTMTDISGISYNDIDEETADEFIQKSLEYNWGTKSDLERMSSMSAYYKGDKPILKERLFPKSEVLSEKHSYAKKHKFLLPLAWCQIICYYIMRLIKNKRNTSLLRNNAKQINLMKKLGLL